MTSLSLSLRGIALVAVAATSDALLPAQCGIDPNYGTSIPLTDDSVSGVQMLGFSLPFAGANYDSVYVSSNGFVYLFDTTGSVPAPTGSRCCNGNVAGLLSSTSPMVCGMWQDLNPGAGGTVNFNALPGKALITWDNVPEFGNATSANTFQIRLYATGVIEMSFDANARAISHTCLTGWSPSNGATDPGGSNLSAVPVLANSATVYELFPAGSFDLAQRSLQATPTSPTSWIIDTPFGCASSSEYGRGCPRPCSFYEFFAGSTFDLSGGSLLFSALGNGAYTVTTCPTNCFDTNFTNNLLLVDDSLSIGNALGFTFPFCGGGATTTVDVCSNGFIWLVSGSSTSSDYSATVAEFLSQPARLAPLWMDLNPTLGGAVYFDALPGKALITWDQVPAFGVPGSSNTIQLQMYPNGNMIVAWPMANNNATLSATAICGLSEGNGIIVPDSTDVSMVPFSTGSGIPMRLAAQAGSRPVIGTTLTMEASQVRPGTIGGSLHIGTSNPGFDLGLIGLPGCFLLSTLDITLPLAVASPVTTVALPIPNLRSFIGRSLTTQVLMVDPTLGGALPLYLSNGLLLTFGN